MIVRPATPADLDIVRRLWQEFEREIPDPVGEPARWEDVRADAKAAVAAGAVLLSLEDEIPSGFAWVTGPVRGVARMEYVYVRPEARERGAAKQLLSAAADGLAERGATDLVLEVVATNEVARSVWERLGFRLIEHRLAAPVAELRSRLGSG
ncbi:MAG: GNAT family N-acetyltransferase [Gaiellaceae bacterium]